MNQTEIIESLNQLIETSRDGDKGFAACAEETENVSLKSFFTISAIRCHDSVRALNEQVAIRGGTPEETGSAAGVAHRVWMDLRTAVSTNNDLTVLEECERAEDVARGNYSDALKQDLPADLRELVQRQLDGVKANLDRVRMMRDELLRSATRPTT